MISMHPWRRAHVCALLLVVLAYAAPASAQLRSVTLAWDPNPEPFVSGYYVYISHTADDTPIRLDVGAVTQFTYRAVLTGVPYYFSVAAYTEDGTAGPQSEQLFYIGGSRLETSVQAPGSAEAAVLPPAAARTPQTPAASPSRSQAAGSLASAAICADNGSACLRAEPVASLSGAAVTAIAALPDGRVAVIEDRRQVFILDSAGRASGPALAANGGEELLGLAADPAFASTGAVIVATGATATRGTRAVSLVRYRELQGVLAQPAVMVTGIEVPADASVPFALDEHGRLYLAVAALDASGHRANGAYAARILRFNADGSASGAAASPVLVQGFETPTALAWDAQRSTLWLSGRDGGMASGLARVVMDQDGRAGPVESMPLQQSFVTSPLTAMQFGSADASAGLAVTSDDGALVGVAPTASGVTAVLFTLPAQQRVLSLSGTPGGAIAVFGERGGNAQTIVRLAP